MTTCIDRRMALLAGLMLSAWFYAQAQYHYGVKQVLDNNGYGYFLGASETDLFIAKYSKDEVKVYTLQPDSSWAYQQTLTPSDKANGDTDYWYYGGTLDVGEEYAMVGAQYKRYLGHEDGGLYFYRKDATGWWVEEDIVENPSVNRTNDTRSYLYYGGKQISINGTTATATHNNGYPRFVHIYERQAGGHWQIKDTITDPEFLGIDSEYPYFKDTVLLTMVYNYHNQRVKEYRLQPNGDWKNTDTLDSGITGEDTYFGAQLAVDGHTLVIGATYMRDETHTHEYMGKVFIYEYVNQKWELVKTLEPPGAAAYMSFGNSVDIRNGMIVVGSYDTPNTGTAVTFYAKQQGQWQQVDRVSRVGYVPNRILIKGSQVLVGTPSGSFVLENLKDCNQDPGGDAELNECDVCYGGHTGIDYETSLDMCVTAVEEPGIEASAKAFPNPFRDHLELKLPAEAQVRLLDAYGNTLLESRGDKVLNTSGISSGLYFLHVRFMEQQQVIKVVKQ